MICPGHTHTHIHTHTEGHSNSLAKCSTNKAIRDGRPRPPRHQCVYQISSWSVEKWLNYDVGYTVTAKNGIYRNFIWGVRTSTPVDLGNYNAYTKMPNTKVVGIIFPYILTPIPNLYDHSFPRYGQITFLTFQRPTTLTFDLKFWKYCQSRCTHT